MSIFTTFKNSDLSPQVVKAIYKTMGYGASSIGGTLAGGMAASMDPNASTSDIEHAAAMGALGGLGLRGLSHAGGALAIKAIEHPTKNLKVNLHFPTGWKNSTTDTMKTHVETMGANDAHRNILADYLMRRRAATDQEIETLRRAAQLRDPNLKLMRAPGKAIEAYVGFRAAGGGRDHILLGNDSSLGIAAHELSHASGTMVPLNGHLDFGTIAEEARANIGAFNLMRKNFGLRRALQEAPGLAYAQGTYMANTAAGNLVTGLPVGMAGALAANKLTPQEDGLEKTSAYQAGREYALKLLS